jgi:hypothetical protein
MKVVKSFEEYLRDGTARRVSIDVQRAGSLRLESRRKQALLTRTIKAMGIDDENANDYIEDCYNIIMYLIRAHMYEHGYASQGHGAHEAEVSYARSIGFNEKDLRTLDELRYFRNGILYYGKRFDKEYAEKIITYAEHIAKKI